MHKASTLLRVVNRYEEIAHGEIKASADRWGLAVYPNVRLADVIDLDGGGVVAELKRYGLQAHFDFVVCRNQWKPDYAIEFDGRNHSTAVQIARNQKKNQLGALAGFPVLRINSNYLSTAMCCCGSPTRRGRSASRGDARRDDRPPHIAQSRAGKAAGQSSDRPPPQP
jgi:hypothetical protein